jgi:hypothetical protein
MAGMKLGTGVNGSVVGNLYGGYGAAAVPAASGIPEGPGTITQQAWGVPGPGSGSRLGLHAAGISTAALVLLVFIWWSLPRLGGSSMRITLGGILVGAIGYWAVQHFFGVGNTGKGS